MKSQRQQLILDIILSRDIDRQEVLRSYLADAGINVTQATLSRDMNELGIRKVTTADGGQKYSAEKKISFELPEFVMKSILSVDYAGNITVFRCAAGSAQAVCAAIDSDGRFGAVGTIAGDDTIFVLMRTESEARHLADRFKKISGKE